MIIYRIFTVWVIGTNVVGFSVILQWDIKRCVILTLKLESQVFHGNASHVVGRG